MARDKALYYVGTQFGPDHRHESRMVRGRKAAFELAAKQGDPTVIYRWFGVTTHWDIILDRSMRHDGQLPFLVHLQNVLGVVVLKPMDREVGTGKPGYRWAAGYLVPTQHGNHEYPPVSRNEAFKRAREVYGKSAIVMIGE